MLLSVDPTLHDSTTPGSPRLSSDHLIRPQNTRSMKQRLSVPFGFPHRRPRVWALVVAHVDVDQIPRGASASTDGAVPPPAARRCIRPRPTPLTPKRVERIHVTCLSQCGGGGISPARGTARNSSTRPVRTSPLSPKSICSRSAAGAPEPRRRDLPVENHRIDDNAAVIDQEKFLNASASRFPDRF